MWNRPWKYREGMLIGGGLWLTGFLLQATVGKIEWDWVAFPVNLILLIAFLILLGVVHILRGKVYLFRWLSHHTAAVSSLCWVVAMTVLMGLIRQEPSSYPLYGMERTLGILANAFRLDVRVVVCLDDGCIGLDNPSGRLFHFFQLAESSVHAQSCRLFVVLAAATLGMAICVGCAWPLPWDKPNGVRKTKRLGNGLNCPWRSN